MATRTVLQLLTKTCSCTYSISSPYSKSHAIPLSASEQISSRSRHSKQQRSFSQPVRLTKFEKILRPRSLGNHRHVSRTAPARKETHYVYEDELNESKSPYSISTLQRDPRRCQEYEEEDVFEATSQRYEIADSSREGPGAHFFDVCNSMRMAQNAKMTKLFPHLQPGNMKPYGSSETVYQQGLEKRFSKVVYPTSSAGSVNNPEWDSHKRRYSIYMKQKVYPGFEEANKVAVCEKAAKPGDSSKKNFSTTSANADKTLTHRSRDIFGKKSTHKIGLVVNKSFTRRSSTSLLKKKNKPATVNSKSYSLQSQDKLQSSKNSFQQSFLVKLLKKRDSGGRDLCICPPPPPVPKKCGEFITVKLKELQEECREAKKCKPKKINFGRLPKMVPPDCPCVEAPPLKEGKPLIPLKRRSEPKEKRVLDCDVARCTTPRADANYKVVRKSLPKIKVEDCPCVEPEWIDFRIKRLPKSKVPEPKRVCKVCGDEDEEPCCIRADGEIKVPRKQLPKLKPNECPCIIPKPLKDIPLKKLVAQPVQEIKKPCKLPCHVLTPRADKDLRVVQKCLPRLKPKCVCVEPPPLEDVKPLKRLRKIVYIEKRVCPPEPCASVCRADCGRRHSQKRLPKFVPQSCPCIEAEIPDKSPKLKALEKRPLPKEKPKVCVTTTCDTPRADEGLKVTPKKLQEIIPGDCPCVEFVMKDTPPLKRLPPMKIKEPERICPCDEAKCCKADRADVNYKIVTKHLPVLPPGNCPCIEAPLPEDVPPLAVLKKRPVVPRKDVCPDEHYCDQSSRADGVIKVAQKKLPKLEPNNCQCVEPIELQPGKPLTRLPQYPDCDPPKDCPRPDDCDSIPRADKDDWLYYRRREERVEDPCVKYNKTSTRSYSTNYRTPLEDLVELKYDVSRLATSQYTDQAYDIVIDIKPSPPLILKQSPIEPRANRRRDLKSMDYVAFVIYKGHNLGITRSNQSLSKENNSKMAEFSALFNSINRFISTYSTICQQNKPGKDHQTPSCECPPQDSHLQPKNPIIQPVESFFKPYPSDEAIVTSTLKSRWYERTRKDDDIIAKAADESCAESEEKSCQEICEEDELVKCPAKEEEKQLTLWERIVNYFKARPNCPTPEEFRKIRLREDAEKAAEKAGLCLYDPKEMLRKNEELPKVITAGCRKEESKKS